MMIRRFNMGDYNDVYSLWLGTSGMGLNDVDDSRSGIEKFLNRNPNTCYVAEESDRIIGVIIAGNDGRRGFIYHTCVDTEFRNKGIGTRLVEAALNALKSEGISKVALVVFERNAGGNAFWEKRGFTERDDLVYRNKALVQLIRTDT